MGLRFSFNLRDHAGRPFQNQQPRSIYFSEQLGLYDDAPNQLRQLILGGADYAAKAHRNWSLPHLRIATSGSNQR